MTPATRPPRLSTQVLLLVVAIITLTVSAGSAVSVWQARRELDDGAGQKSLAIAHAVAATPAVIDAFSAPDPARVIDPIVEQIRRSTGTTFIVVADRRGIRYSHPNPAKLNTSLLHDRGENPTAVLAGRTFVGVEDGSLGRSMRAKVPLRDARGQIIGLVSVGLLEARVSSRLRSSLPVALIPPLLGLVLGTVGAFFLSRRVRRQTFGLEPEEIAALLEQREAMLHGIREGTITLDAEGRITLLNDEAQRLLGLPESDIGRKVADVVPADRVRDVFTGRTEGRDETILLGDRVLVVNRMPVEVRGQSIGAVITLRDRTELEGLLRELDDMRSLADALRAQEHEFANRLHVLGGLIELRRYDDAVQFIDLNSRLHQKLASSLIERVGDPVLSGLLLGKAAVASERGVKLNISVPGGLPDEFDEPDGLVTILGNLIDNALDSASSGATGGHVDVSMTIENGDLVIVVHDSGTGIDPALTDEIFRDGFTTKVAREGNRRRGLGLALVSREVRRRGGRVGVDNMDGARFTVTLPSRARSGELEAPRP